MLFFVIVSIIQVIIFSLGIFVGWYLKDEGHRKLVKQKVERLIEGEPDLGVVHRPTAEDLRKRGTIEGETEEVMEETFEELLK